MPLSLRPSLVRAALLLGLFVGMGGSPLARAAPADALKSVVSVLPVWRGRPQGGAGARPGVAPEGSGVAIRPGGVIATARHVVARAVRIDVRLSDGRVLPARLIAQDEATDIALLRTAAPLPPLAIAPEAAVAARACAIGNAYGLGLSVTCGVVSARAVTEAGFNAIEDFVQTDAAVNPGMSGGALVDEAGRMVGMLSAIFASKGDGDVGVNFAVSSALLTRVADALLTEGSVKTPEPGWRLARASRAQLATRAGAAVAAATPGGPAAAAGVEAGDLLVRVGTRAIRKPRDAAAALALSPQGAASIDVVVVRDGEERRLTLSFAGAPDKTATPAAPAPGGSGAARTPATPAVPPPAAPPLSGAGGAAPGTAPGDCPHPAAVCGARQAVFPISSFIPIASATRIGPTLLVTNRHNVADRADVVVYTPNGPRDGAVVASAYTGDLALIEVSGLPEDGRVLTVGATPTAGPVFAVGADVGRQIVRVFAPGVIASPPAPGAALGRLHVTARMQPGVSGGALVDQDGNLVGVAAGGGDGRFEAIPERDVRALLEMRGAADAAAVQKRLGAALARCSKALDAQRAGGAGALAELAEACRASRNQGQYLAAGRALARGRDIAGAIDLHRRAVEQTPNSVNARLSLLVSLQLGGRFPAMLPHARWVMAAAPNDPGALRFAIQSGVWGGDKALAEQGYQKLLKADPRQAQAARRFIDNAPPAPPRR